MLALSPAVTGSLVGGAIGWLVVVLGTGVANFFWARSLYPGTRLRLARRYLPLIVWEPRR